MTLSNKNCFKMDGKMLNYRFNSNNILYQKSGHKALTLSKKSRKAGAEPGPDQMKLEVMDEVVV